MKRLLPIAALCLAFVFAIPALAIVMSSAEANTQQRIYLGGSANDPVPLEWVNVFSVGGAEINSPESRAWHLILSGEHDEVDVIYMHLTFKNAEGEIAEVFGWYPEMGFSAPNEAGHVNLEWIIFAPYGWELYQNNHDESGSYVELMAQSGGSFSFNIIGYDAGISDPDEGGPDLPLPPPNEVAVYVTGNFVETYYRIYQPVLASESGTLVSHANFAGSWSLANQTFPIGEGVRGGFYARPGGNANNMHNGFTFLEINVAQLQANPDGVNVIIARSNQSNGNTPNASWNTPILDGNASYNVRIVGGELIVTINNFISGSWGATITNNLANWGNNPNSAIRHQRNESLNLGRVSGTTFLFFHGQSFTFGTDGGERIEGPFSRPANVDYEVIILNQAEEVIYTGGFGSIVLPNDLAVGTHYFTVLLRVGDVDFGTDIVQVEVTQNGAVTTLVLLNDVVDFGTLIIGPGENVIIRR